MIIELDVLPHNTSKVKGDVGLSKNIIILYIALYRVPVPLCYLILSTEELCV